MDDIQEQENNIENIDQDVNNENQILLSDIVNETINIFQKELFEKYNLEPIDILKENLNYDSLDNFKKSLSDQIKKLNIKPKIKSKQIINKKLEPKIYF